MRTYTRLFNNDSHLRGNPFLAMIDSYQELFDAEMAGLTNEVISKGAHQMIHAQVEDVLMIYEATMEGKLEMGRHNLTEEEYQNVKEAKKQASEVIDSFIEVMNEEMGEKDVTVNSPKRLKYEFLKQMHKEVSMKNKSGA